MAAVLPPSFLRRTFMNIDHITDITIHFNDPQWILEHITIGLQTCSDNDIIKRPCDLDGIEQYLFLKGKLSDTSYSIKITPNILSHAGIDENCAWEKAMENLCTDTQITSLTKLLSDMSGIPSDAPSEPDIHLHVITNSEKYKGAATIMNRKALRSFAREHHTNMLFVLPSSVHEMMISPFTAKTTADELSAIVREVNETQVAPEERLTDRAYILCL